MFLLYYIKKDFLQEIHCHVKMHDLSLIVHTLSKAWLIEILQVEFPTLIFFFKFLSVSEQEAFAKCLYI